MLVSITRQIISEFRGPPRLIGDIGNDISEILARHDRRAGGVHYFAGIDNPPDETPLSDAYSHYEREKSLKIEQERIEQERIKHKGEFFQGFQRHLSDIHELKKFVETHQHLLYAVETKWFHSYFGGLTTVQKFAKKSVGSCLVIGGIFVTELERRGEYNEVTEGIWLKFLKKHGGVK